MTSPSIAASAGHDRKAGSAVKEAEVKDIGIIVGGATGRLCYRSIAEEK